MMELNVETLIKKRDYDLALAVLVFKVLNGETLTPYEKKALELSHNKVNGKFKLEFLNWSGKK